MTGLKPTEETEMKRVNVTQAPLLATPNSKTPQGESMNTELSNYLRSLYPGDCYPHFRAKYSSFHRLEGLFVEHSSDPLPLDFGAGWEFELSALELSEDTGDHSFSSQITVGISTSLTGAYEAVKVALPKEARPFISHQLLGRRERFYWAYEFELANGSDALHEELESGWLEKFELSEGSLDGDPPWADYEDDFREDQETGWLEKPSHPDGPLDDEPIPPFQQDDG
jgi:hypothetical protein